MLNLKKCIKLNHCLKSQFIMQFHSCLKLIKYFIIHSYCPLLILIFSKYSSPSLSPCAKYLSFSLFSLLQFSTAFFSKQSQTLFEFAMHVYFIILICSDASQQPLCAFHTPISPPGLVLALKQVNAAFLQLHNIGSGRNANERAQLSLPLQLNGDSISKTLIGVRTLQTYPLQCCRMSLREGKRFLRVEHASIRGVIITVKNNDKSSHKPHSRHIWSFQVIQTTLFHRLSTTFIGLVSKPLDSIQEMHNLLLVYAHTIYTKISLPRSLMSFMFFSTSSSRKHPWDRTNLFAPPILGPRFDLAYTKISLYCANGKEEPCCKAQIIWQSGLGLREPWILNL